VIKHDDLSSAKGGNGRSVYLGKIARQALCDIGPNAKTKATNRATRSLSASFTAGLTRAAF
jgi:hypothetical protein